MLIRFLTHLGGLAATFLLFLFVSPQPAGGLVARDRFYQRAAPSASSSSIRSFEKRQLRAETLDGSIVEPIVVDYLDQYEYYQNEVDNGNAAVGSEQYNRLLDETRTVSEILTDLIRGYATIVSVDPSIETSTIPEPGSTVTFTVDSLPIPTTTPTGASTIIVEQGPPSPSSTSPSSSSQDRTAAPTSTVTAAPQPPPGSTVTTTTTSLEITIVSQPNTIIIASQGTTTTVTNQVPTPSPGTGNRGQAGAGEPSERPVTTIITVRNGATQTVAVGASAEMTLGAGNGAARLSPVVALVGAGMMAFFVNVL